MRRPALALLAAVSCGPAQPPAGEPGLPLPWVNPARCVRPCTHPDESHLVGADGYGRAASGPHRLDRGAQPWLEAMLAAAARPGHSEHELGLGVDLAFDPPAQAWLEAHAWEFGFVLSYPDGAERVTGFRWEPWHFRYAGASVARTLHEQPGLTLEELFETSPGLGESGDCSDCPRPESNSTCSGLTAGGVCDGAVMRWCFKGAANAIDCALIARSCRADLPRAVCVE